MSGTSTAERPGAVERRLPAHPASVSQARTLVRDLLVEADRPELVETAVLLVSEVVTNALLHAGHPDRHLGLARRRGPAGRGRPTAASTSRSAAATRRPPAPVAGMLMLEEMVDDWGVSRHRQGKTVWFHLTSPGRNDERVELQEAGQPRRTAGETATVELLEMPLLLHAAWQEHAEALLREYLLASLDDESGINAIQMHADATDAIALLEEQIPHIEVAMAPDQLMNDATEPFVTLRRAHDPGAGRLAAALPDALRTRSRPARELARHRTDPDAADAARDAAVPKVAVRRGARVKPTGAAPTPWSVDRRPRQSRSGSRPCGTSPRSSRRPPASSLPTRLIRSSRSARRRSRSWATTTPGSSIGQRLLAIIPDRFRQAHVAGFTMFFLVGRQPLVGKPIEVPALRRDGSELTVRLRIRSEKVGEGRTVFLADIGAVEEQA